MPGFVGEFASQTGVRKKDRHKSIVGDFWSFGSLFEQFASSLHREECFLFDLLEFFDPLVNVHFSAIATHSLCTRPRRP